MQYAQVLEEQKQVSRKIVKFQKNKRDKSSPDAKPDGLKIEKCCDAETEKREFKRQHKFIFNQKSKQDLKNQKTTDVLKKLEISEISISSSSLETIGEFLSDDCNFVFCEDCGNLIEEDRN